MSAINLNPFCFEFEFTNNVIPFSNPLVFLIIGYCFLSSPFVFLFGEKVKTKEKLFNWILFTFGVILLSLELYKQLMYAYIYDYFPGGVNAGHYYFKILPFQLCSLHMFILPFIPFIKNKRIVESLVIFSGIYSFIGGFAVLTIGRSYVLGPNYILSDGTKIGDYSMYLHTLLWHTILVHIGLFVFGFYQFDKIKKKDIIKYTMIGWIPCAICCVFFQVINYIVPLIVGYEDPWIEGFNLWNISTLYGINLPIFGEFLNSLPVWLGGTISCIGYCIILYLAGLLVLWLLNILEDGTEHIKLKLKKQK